MNLRLHDGPRYFLDHAQAMLEKREAANNLLLGAVIRLDEHPDWTDTPPYLAVVEDDGARPVVAAAIMPPRSLLLGSEPGLTAGQLDEALELLAQALLTQGRPVPGVNAEETMSERFARAWERAAGKSYRSRTRLRVYELRLVIPPANPPPGRLRQATQTDTDLVTRWHLEFSLEATGHGSLEESQKHIARQVEIGNIYLWDDHGPVSMAARARPTPHGCTVTGVYTPPAMRGKGYASACVAALSQFLLDSGKQFCDLFTDLSNPTSNSIYQRIGYRPVCDFNNIVFGD